MLASTSLCFDLSVFELFVPLCLGGTAILVDDALHLASCPSASEVTLINTVPSAADELVRWDRIPESVHTINLAGEPLPNSLAQRLYRKETVERVFNLYGPTESTVYSTFAAGAKGEMRRPRSAAPSRIRAPTSSIDGDNSSRAASRASCTSAAMGWRVDTGTVLN